MNKVVSKSKYDYAVHKRYYNFHLMRRSSIIYILLVLALLMIFLAVRNTYLYKDDTANSGNIITSWIIAIFTIIMIPGIRFFRITSVVNKEGRERGESIETLEVTKHKMIRYLQGVDSKVVLGWDRFYFVCETEDSFYFYLNKDTGLVMPKKDIVEGDAEIMRKLIVDNMPKNRKGKIAYKNYTKDKKRKCLV